MLYRYAAHAQQHEQQNGFAASIGHTAKVMANKGVKDDAKWMALIEDAKAVSKYGCSFHV